LPDASVDWKATPAKNPVIMPTNGLSVANQYAIEATPISNVPSTLEKSSEFRQANHRWWWWSYQAQWVCADKVLSSI